MDDNHTPKSLEGVVRKRSVSSLEDEKNRLIEKRKKNAEYQRAYRKRMKTEQKMTVCGEKIGGVGSSQDLLMENNSSINNLNGKDGEGSVVLEEDERRLTKKRKKDAERAQAYRKRKKTDTLVDGKTVEGVGSLNNAVQKGISSLEAGNAKGMKLEPMSSDERERVIEQKKKRAEYQRLYRKRKKMEKEKMIKDAKGVESFHGRVNESVDKEREERKEIGLLRNVDFNLIRMEFSKRFLENDFGYACGVCDRLWFKNDLKVLTMEEENFLFEMGVDKLGGAVCGTCSKSLKERQIPSMSVHNGFKYPVFPSDLPKLDLVSERLVSPRIPFMQIRRLRHVNGQYGILGQIINVPICVNTMVSCLPRNLDDDYCINVHIKRQKIHKTSFVSGFINKGTIKSWLTYLVETPLYKLNNIKIDSDFFDNGGKECLSQDDVSEHISYEDSITAQQQTLLWDEEKYLRIAPGEKNVPMSLLFDEFAEELSFPSIYLGEMRRFREGIRVTPFMMASSELRRRDRRGVTPYHLLYVAMKIMRIRVRDSLTVAFKHVGKTTKITLQQIEDENYLNNCIESNLAFLKCIPNSIWYWLQRKKDLFAMIRQMGNPFLFLTISANEVGWNDLIRILYRLKSGRLLSDEEINNLHYLVKTTLINEDPVCCVIFFNKLLNVILSLLVAKTLSPFGQHYVTEYFQRIEFQHRGSPHGHFLLWAANASEDVLGRGKSKAIAIIDTLISVSIEEAGENVKLQTHKHTFTCYKKIVADKEQECRFGAPFMPSRVTMILTPLDKKDDEHKKLSVRYKEIKKKLESEEYANIEDFFKANGIASDAEYEKILRAGITRPMVFLKRLPKEKWINAFNPFLLSILKSNMDIQVILEEYSCATYCCEYVNKCDRGVSQLQRKIIQIMNENPDFDINQVTRKLGVDMLNGVEMSSQEAAWFLLREPMSYCSTVVRYIPTVWPSERHRIKRSAKELADMNVGEDSTNIWKDNYFDKYEKRPKELEDVSLAQFVSHYNVAQKHSKYVKREVAAIIRYRNYDMGKEFNEFKREMVTLHIPFRNEHEEILAETKFINVYAANELVINERRKEFESNFDIAKTMALCRELEESDVFNRKNLGEEVMQIVDMFGHQNPYEQFIDGKSEMNDDLKLAMLNKVGPIAKKRENVMGNEDFYALMRNANMKQKELLLHIIYQFFCLKREPLQIFFSGPAGCGKTFLIKLIKEIYNRFCYTDGFCNSYLVCASTGKAAVAIDGTTVHSALKISLSRLLSLSIEVVYQYRALFKFIKVIIIDEVSMIGAELLNQIDSRLKQITGNYDSNFGGLDVIFVGDLRQLPPVRATPVYRQQKQKIYGPMLWRSLKFFRLEEVMRQENKIFSTLLTKIGNGEILDSGELSLLESRFVKNCDIDTVCPKGLRLFLHNNSVQSFNNKLLNNTKEKRVSIATDMYVGCCDKAQEASMRQKVHKMSVVETNGLPYETVFAKGFYYMITTNIDVQDGLANGAVGKLVHVECNGINEVSLVWLEFSSNSKIGQIAKRKYLSRMNSLDFPKNAIPIFQRKCSVALNGNKTIFLKRTHIPLVCACASTIHKSQGSTYSEIVYEYDKNHAQALVYVALSRVTDLNGLYIVTKNDDHVFYHGRTVPKNMNELQLEFERLEKNQLVTAQQQLLNFLCSGEQGVVLYLFNCQSLKCHQVDLERCEIVSRCEIMLLTETWMGNDENVDIAGFKCIAQHRRDNITAGGVGIFQKVSEAEIIMSLVNSDIPSMICDFCMSECRSKNFTFTLMAVYFKVNLNIQSIIDFIEEYMSNYFRGHERLVMAGDFNVDFGCERSKPLVEYLAQRYGLELRNDVRISTTRGGTVIDAVFSRLVNIKLHVYASYFSYHRPIIVKCYA